MDKTTQPFLPKIKKVGVFVKDRKTPEPGDISEGIIRKYEIQYRPFDLKFRGRLSGWLVNFKDEIQKLVNPSEKKILDMYLFKNDNKWFTQNEIADKLKMRNSRQVSKTLRDSLHKIWNLKHK